MKLSEKQLWFQEIFFGEFLPWARKWAKRNGYQLMVTEVYRPPEQAARNAAMGVGIKNTNHGRKLATDIILWRLGVPIWDSALYEPLGEKWESLSRQWRDGRHKLVKLVCCWGGRFRRRKDGGHFSFLHNGVK
jgi:hypothetical protein